MRLFLIIEYKKTVLRHVIFVDIDKGSRGTDIHPVESHPVQVQLILEID